MNHRLELPPNASALEIVRFQVERLPRDQKRVVYYPGIGGVEEKIDIFSPFDLLNAHEVWGVDIWDEKVTEEVIRVALTDTEARLRRVLLKNKIKEEPRIEENNGVWTAHFVWINKLRRLNIFTSQIDATQYAPGFDFNMIFSSRSYRLVTHLPNDVLRKAQIIVDQEKMRDEAYLVREWARENSERLGIVEVPIWNGVTSLFVKKL